METIINSHDNGHNAAVSCDKTTRYHGNRSEADNQSDAGIEADFGSHSDVNAEQKNCSTENDRKAENSIVPSLEAYLTCPFCDRQFRNPQRLPCGHTMCSNCIATIIGNECTVKSCDNDTVQRPVPNTIADYLLNQSSEPFKPCQHIDTPRGHNSTDPLNMTSCQKCQNRHDFDVITNLKTTVREIRRRLTDLNEEKQIWQKRFSTLNHQYDLAKDKVEDIFHDLDLHLENRKKERLSRLDEIVTTRSNELSANIQRVDSLSLKTDLLLDEIKRLCQLGKIDHLLLLRMRLRCLAILAEMECMDSLTDRDTEISFIDIKDYRQSLMHYMDTCLTNNIRVVFS